MYTFIENGQIDETQLNELYRLIGWDSSNRRTSIETKKMLDASHFYISAHAGNGSLVGFARIAGDTYVAQVLDVITHPEHRRRGIATQCMNSIVAYLHRSTYVTVTLSDASGVADFYKRFGFNPSKDVAMKWENKPP